MAQISRPFQIALIAVLGIAALGVLFLRLHPSSSSSSSAAATPASVSPSATVVKDKGSTVDTTKAKATTKPARGHQALHAAKVHAAAGAASKTAASNTAAKPATPAKTAAPAPSVHKADSTKGSTSSAAALATVSGQRRVEAQLAHGDIALVLFWNPKGTEDVSVHQAVQAVARHPGVGVEEAPASAVASFGTITRGIQIYQTPTLLVINKQGKTTVITGVPDAYTIEQAISEARHS